MNISIPDNVLPLIYTGVGALAVWLLGKLWNIGENSHKKLIEATNGLTHAMIEVKVEIKNLKDNIAISNSKTDKLQGDVNEAHAKIREIRASEKKTH